MSNNASDNTRNNMSYIKSKDSAIELALRKELWRRGLRYRKNVRFIYGCPDIVFPKQHIAVFCDSEFWHGYNWEKQKNTFKSNQDFWIPKIERNIQRDKEVNEKLQKDGWIVIRFWGEKITKDVSGCADIVESFVRGKARP